MKLSHGEVKSINNPMQIRASESETAAAGMFGRAPFKFDFAKMSISGNFAQQVKFVQNPKISLQNTVKLISAHQNFAKLARKFLELEPAG